MSADVCILINGSKTEQRGDVVTSVLQSGKYKTLSAGNVKENAATDSTYFGLLDTHLDDPTYYTA